MPVLNGQQREKLRTFIGDAFDFDALAELVRYTLDQRLEDIAAPALPLPEIIFALLDWVDYRGPGSVETLLRGIVEARPGRAEIREFCEAHFPKALRPFDGGEIVDAVAKGLHALAALKDDGVVQATVGRFRADFETGAVQIRVLRSYKALHESLHRLQLQLATIGDAITRAPTDSGARRNLGRYALDLKQLASHARASAMAVPSRSIELPWIDDFDGCVKVLSSAASGDGGRLARIPDQLRSLLSEAPRINNVLANLAAGLRLESLSMAMKTITDHLKLPPDSATVQPLTAGLHALSLLGPRLAGLVTQHFEWQWIEKELVAAEMNPAVAPADKILRWTQFKPRLATLCALDANGEWSQDVQARLTQWEATAANGSDEGAFDGVRHICLLRFFDVDAELDTLCAQLLMIAVPLDTLLRVIDS